MRRTGAGGGGGEREKWEDPTAFKESQEEHPCFDVVPTQSGFPAGPCAFSQGRLLAPGGTWVCAGAWSEQGSALALRQDLGATRTADGAGEGCPTPEADSPARLQGGRGARGARDGGSAHFLCPFGTGLGEAWRSSSSNRETSIRVFSDRNTAGLAVAEMQKAG